MNKISGFRQWVCMAVAVAVLAGAGVARAESGDDAAIAKARRDYEDAKRSGDLGLMNAMKITLDVQLAKARARGAKKDAASGNADADHKKADPKSS